MGSWKTAGGTPRYSEDPIDWGNAVIWRFPDETRKKLFGGLVEYGRTGRLTEGGSRCAAWVQRLGVKVGAPGFYQGMGNANSMGGALAQAGGVRVTDGTVLPGDVVQYVRGHGRYGHIGIAAGMGRGQTYRPAPPQQRVSVSRRIGRVARNWTPPEIINRQPDPMQELMVQSRLTREPELSMGERTILGQIAQMVPDVAGILERLFLE